MDEASVRVADAGTDTEGVRAPAVSGSGQRDCKVGDELAAVRAAHAAKADKAVVGQECRRGDFQVGRVEGLRLGWRANDPEGAAAMGLAGRPDGHVQSSVRGRKSLRLLAHVKNAPDAV